MKLRHLVLLISSIGASGALLLAADIYRRLKEAEAAMVLASGPVRDDSVLTFGMAHTIGLLSLAFLFLALFLMLMVAVRDKQFVAVIETGSLLPEPARTVATETSAPAVLETTPPAEFSPPAEVSQVVATPPDTAPPSAEDATSTLAPVEVIPIDTAPPVASPASEPEVPPQIVAAEPERRVLAFEEPVPTVAKPVPPAPEIPPPLPTADSDEAHPG